MNNKSDITVMYHSNVAVFETSLDCDIGMTDALW